MLTRRLALAAFWAAVVLAACEFGYAIATEIRGGSNATSTVAFWLTAAVIAGPPLDVGGAWTRRMDWFGASTGPSVLAGVLIGEPIYALSTIADTTTPAYWLAELAVGVTVVVLTCVRIVSRDLRPRWAIPLCVATAGLVAAAVAVIARLACLRASSHGCPLLVIVAHI